MSYLQCMTYISICTNLWCITTDTAVVAMAMTVVAMDTAVLDVT